MKGRISGVGRVTSKIPFLAFILIILMVVPPTVSARDIIVGNGSGSNSTIQEAVDGAETGDVIIVKSGTYVENIIVSKAGLTIKPETNGNVFIEPADSSKPTIVLRNVGTTLSGLNIVGSIHVNNALLGDIEYYRNNMSQITNNIVGGISVGSESSGIIISGNKISGGFDGIGIHVACCGDYNEIINNEISNCTIGIYAYDERNMPPISGNKINNCTTGILVSGLTYDIVSNEITNCGIGVHSGETGSANLIGNKIMYCTDCGLKVSGYLGDKGAYNNYFNNTVNVKFEDMGTRTHTWNGVLSKGTNIIGGSYIGGNYWAKPDGTGFSQTCVDSDGNGISDTVYSIDDNNHDYLPLTYPYNSVLPNANFTSNVTSGTVPLVVLFTDTSIGGVPTSWYWDTGDGIHSKHAMNATHTFTKPGTYNVTLTVANAAGSSSITKPDYITVTSPTAKPVADFYSPEAEKVFDGTSGHGIYENEVVSFFDNSTGSPTSWLWDFGDGNTSTQKNPTHVYGKMGGYTVNLIVKNDAGNDIKSKYGYVLVGIGDEPSSPAYFSSDVTSGSAPLTVTFLDDLDAELPNYPIWRQWNFGDGIIQSYMVDNNVSATPYATHTYEKPGKYTVILYLDNRGGKSIITKYNYITVTDPATDPQILVAKFSSNVTKGYAPLAVQFSDLSENAVSRAWDFNNDGKIDSNNPNPVYVYAAPGTYFVNLTVTNANGISYKVTTINVLENSSNDDDSSSKGSSSGSSSGGGGGGSPEPARNVAVKELSQAYVINDKAIKFDFPKNATCVVYVVFDSKKTAGKTTTIVEQLKGKSTLVSELPAGEVYKSFNVWVGNSGFATSSNIENPVICFKIEKDWIRNKNIDLASITLNRYDKKWEKLPVNVSGEDDKYLYFTANVPKYESFAITGIPKETVTEVETGIANKNTTDEGIQNNATDDGIQTEQKELMSGFGICCAVGILCLFVRIRK